MTSTHRYSVLFVCTGNICRSVTAEAVFSKMVADAGLSGLIRVDSAGTHGYHIGEPPDPRSQLAARRRGYDMSRLRARKLERRDFETFDLLLAMDDDHYRIMSRMANPAAAHKIRMMMAYARNASHSIVPDPYYGGPEGFELVLDLLEDSCEGLLAEVRAELEYVR
ncbi:MAG: low molecular weight protein-tyrosine-phosphatase [Pseudomonadota bacterium]|nr:MAG: phosphotyrosine protein phosphatase [Pseudomonadota bacterium]